MITCPRCETEVPDGYKHCHNCGKNLEEVYDYEKMTEEEKAKMERSKTVIAIGCFLLFIFFAGMFFWFAINSFLVQR